MTEFAVKDSGERMSFDSGMVRDTTEGKTDYSLVLDGPMFKRWAVHLTKGAVKYAKRNWMKARGQAELDRFRESALRHFLQWFDGETDEDHAAALFFNINGAEYVRDQMKSDMPDVLVTVPITRSLADTAMPDALVTVPVTAVVPGTVRRARPAEAVHTGPIRCGWEFTGDVEGRCLREAGHGGEHIIA